LFLLLFIDLSKDNRIHSTIQFLTRTIRCWHRNPCRNRDFPLSFWQLIRQDRTSYSTTIMTQQHDSHNPITSSSKNDIPTNRQLITEGSISMLYPKDVVFYNPVQVQNRDLSIIMIQMYAERHYKRMMLSIQKKKILKNEREKMKNQKDGGSKKGKKPQMNMKEVEEQLSIYEQSVDWKKVILSGKNACAIDGGSDSSFKGIRILDALAASGLRSLRYYKELMPTKLIDSITINDLDEAAVDLAKENIEYNDLIHALQDHRDDNNQSATTNHNEAHQREIHLKNEDATHLMYMSRQKPNPYIHAPTTTKSSTLQDQYDVIDLDPYGTASPFIDSAIQAVTNGGMLAITCTDMNSLGGSHPDTCYARYNAMPISKAKYLQELALRMLLGNIARRAAVYGRSIKPILSVGMAFYVRVFVEVWEYGPDVKNLSLRIGNVHQSVQCPSFHVVPHGQQSKHNEHLIQPTRAPLIPCCSESGGAFKTAGPIWLGPLHDQHVTKEAVERLEDLGINNNNKKIMKKVDEAPGKDVEDTNSDNDQVQLFQHIRMKKELHGLLTVVSEELNDVPLYYVLPDLCHTLGCSTPPIKSFKAAIINAGYRVSGYHKEAQAVKTDAPNHVIWDVLRVWCNENPPKSNSKKKENKRKKLAKKNNDNNTSVDINTTRGEEDKEKAKETKMTVAEKILAVEPTIKVDFTIPKELKEIKKVCRFPKNPEAHWGPKKAASGYKRKAEEIENQSQVKK